LPPLGALERLLAEVLATARWWEEHLVEVLVNDGTAFASQIACWLVADGGAP
jgi:hypothetical protein